GSAPIVLREYLYQDLMRSLLALEPRIPSDSFAYVGTARFFLSPDGHVCLRLHASFEIPYPAGYAFPLPDGGSTTVTSDSQLYPFVNLLCIDAASLSEARTPLRV